MMTSAGRLSSTISQGSPSRSATRERPIDDADHRAERHGDDEGDHDACQRRAEIDGECARARLLARSRARPPAGPAAAARPASCEPAYQTAMSSASETSLAPS